MSTLQPLADAFRAAMRTWASSVAVVAVDCGGRTHGATATAVVSLSASPPTLLVSLHTEGRTRALVACAGAVSVSVLGADGAALSDHFGGRSAHPEAAPDRFEGVPHHPGATGAPVLDAAIASVEGTVVETWEHADHTVFVVRTPRRGAPRVPGPPLPRPRSAHVLVAAGSSWIRAAARGAGRAAGRTARGGGEAEG